MTAIGYDERMRSQTKQRNAAKKIAEIMYGSLQQFSEKEQQKRVREIQQIGKKAGHGRH
jgi:hypothetical protein